MKYNYLLPVLILMLLPITVFSQFKFQSPAKEWGTENKMKYTLIEHHYHMKTLDSLELPEKAEFLKPLPTHLHYRYYLKEKKKDKLFIKSQKPDTITFYLSNHKNKLWKYTLYFFGQRKYFTTNQLSISLNDSLSDPSKDSLTIPIRKYLIASNENNEYQIFPENIKGLDLKNDTLILKQELRHVEFTFSLLAKDRNEENYQDTLKFINKKRGSVSPSQKSKFYEIKHEEKTLILKTKTDKIFQVLNPKEITQQKVLQLNHFWRLKRIDNDVFRLEIVLWRIILLIVIALAIVGGMVWLIVYINKIYFKADKGEDPFGSSGQYRTYEDPPQSNQSDNNSRGNIKNSEFSNQYIEKLDSLDTKMEQLIKASQTKKNDKEFNEKITKLTNEKEEKDTKINELKDKLQAENKKIEELTKDKQEKENEISELNAEIDKNKEQLNKISQNKAYVNNYETFITANQTVLESFDKYILQVKALRAEASEKNLPKAKQVLDILLGRFFSQYPEDQTKKWNTVLETMEKFGGLIAEPKLASSIEQESQDDKKITKLTNKLIKEVIYPCSIWIVRLLEEARNLERYGLTNPLLIEQSRKVKDSIDQLRTLIYKKYDAEIHYIPLFEKVKTEKNVRFQDNIQPMTLFKEVEVKEKMIPIEILYYGFNANALSDKDIKNTSVIINK